MGRGGLGVGGAVSFVACLGHLTIDHARIPFETEHRSYSSERHLQHSGAHYASSMYYMEIVCLSYPRPVSPSATTIYLLGSRLFSRYSLFSLPYSSIPHTSNFQLLISLSPPLTIAFLLVYFTFSCYGARSRRGWESGGSSSARPRVGGRFCIMYSDWLHR